MGQTTCRLYSYYITGNSSSGWSPTNCYCLPGYYFSSTISCSKCDITCLTCSGASSSNCLTCYEGYYLSGTVCSSSASSQVYSTSSWTSASGYNSYFTSSQQSQMKTCGSYYTLLGYMATFSTSDYYQFNTFNLISAQNYYGVSFVLRVLFIDNWDTSSGIYVTLNSNTNPSFIYNYNNYGAIGEQ